MQSSEQKKSFDSENCSQGEDADSVGEEEEVGKETEEEKDLRMKLLKAINKTLTAILEENKKLSDFNDIVKEQQNMPFSCRTVPRISLYDYLTRIQHYSMAENSTLILALIFIDRICDISGLTLTYYNIHRVLFGSVLIAIKYNEDSYYDNNYYADIAGVKLSELMTIEFNFLTFIKFELFVPNEQYEKYKNYLFAYGNNS